MYNLYLLIYLFITKGVSQFMRNRAKETLAENTPFISMLNKYKNKQKPSYLIKELKMHFGLRRNTNEIEHTQNTSFPLKTCHKCLWEG